MNYTNATKYTIIDNIYTQMSLIIQWMNLGVKYFIICAYIAYANPFFYIIMTIVSLRRITVVIDQSVQCMILLMISRQFKDLLNYLINLRSFCMNMFIECWMQR